MPYMCTAYGRLYSLGFTRTVGVVWVCRRFEYSHFCRRSGVAVLTVDLLTYSSFFRLRCYAVLHILCCV